MIHVGGFLPWDKKYTNVGPSGGKHDPVLGEWHYAEILSCYNAYMDADALGYSSMANASVKATSNRDGVTTINVRITVCTMSPHWCT